MSKFSVKYTPLNIVDPISKSKSKAYKPALDIMIMGANRQPRTFECLVDSMASVNLFPSSIALNTLWDVREET